MGAPKTRRMRRGRRAAAEWNGTAGARTARPVRKRGKHMTTEQLRHRMPPILKALKERSLRGRTPVEGLRRTECAYHGWDTVHADAASWEPFAPGDAFGGLEAHHCFKGTVTLPEASAGKRVVCLVSTGASDIWNNNNPQFLAYVDGRLVCGLDVNHNEFDLAACAVPGESHELALYVYCNTPARDVFLRVETAERDDDVTGLYYDLRAPYEVCALLADDDTRAIGIMKHLNRALNLLDLRDLDSGAFAQSVRDAREYLRTEFYDGFCGRTDATEACVGHTHIDVAWLWSLAQTREKAIRSFASVDYLMERYPEYTFMSSQPQLYDFVKRDCPALYERIRARVAQGRWEPEGGMWLEADCNMSSGESLVRQFLHGKRFFRDAFGRENRILWLPDAFGFSGALPQIMKQCGADYFMTTKLAWNDTDMMPHDVTHWRGIDGSEVLAYFISTKDYVKKPDKDPNPSFNTTYNGILAPRQVMGCWQRFQDKTLTDDVLQCYGYGDGGGGPTAEMLELQRRLAYGIPGAPRTRQSTSLAFFEELERRLAGQDVPCWCGEFYFEYHRGVFTTMARNKRYNRLAEFKNADAELFSALNLACGTAHAYPAEALAHNWELTLLNQFHDILPGSSIEKVYEDSMEQYEQVLASDAALIGDAQNALAALVRADGDGVLVFNQLGFARDALVRVPVEAPVAGVLADGRPLPFRWADGELCFVAAELPAKGWRHYRFAGCASAPVPFAQVSEDGRRITTPFYEAELDACGAFTRLYDIAAKQETDSVSSINRENGARTMSVSAGVDARHNIGLVSRELEKKLADYELPEGYTVEIAGENETINSAMTDLVKMIALAVVFIYLIMVAQFQSLMSPFIVMFTIPLAFTGGLLALWLTGSELSVIAMLGFLVLAGVVVNNGIVFVDNINQLRLAGMDRTEAILETGRTRIRPVLMTALTTILAMSTMALGIGDGAEMTQPMAIVTIGGLTYATLLTLLVVPVLYDIFRKKPLYDPELDDAAADAAKELPQPAAG